MRVTSIFSFTLNIFYPFKYLSFDQFSPFPNLMAERKKVKSIKIIERKEDSANQYM